MKKILVILLCALSATTFAQNRAVSNYITKLSEPDPISGARVSITLDRESRTALSAFTEMSTIDGYRICIFFDNSQSGRQLGNSALAQFRSKYPGTSCDFSYNEPVYKIQVGGYMTRSEANMMLGAIKSSFPKAFIVPTPLALSLFTSLRTTSTPEDESSSEPFE